MTQYKKSLKIKEYFTVDSSENGIDTFVSYYPTAAEAIKAAKDDWNHLTRSEQEGAIVSAWKITQSCVRNDLIDDDKPWWEAAADRDVKIASVQQDVKSWEQEKAEELAAKIRASGTWDLDQLEELCGMADMADEWEKADGDSFENVAFAAAKKLGVELI